ncbi:MAG: hypothetical protein SNF33_07425 [Candidatus Algichlamydia australiensis]|nr:hypothetical protein [Chlamydiales bacterium]
MKKMAIIGLFSLFAIGNIQGENREDLRGLRGDTERVEVEEQNEHFFLLEDDAIIEYDIFALAKGETLSFKQKSQDSWGLVRFTSKEPVKISGKVVANGNLLLCCPAGFVIDGTMKSAGMILTAKEITDRSFLSDDAWQFAESGGDIYVSGTIEVTDSDLYLFADKITNIGDWAGPDKMWAATHKKITLFPNQGVGEALGSVHNNGQIRANSIKIDSKEVVNTGVVAALGLEGSVEMFAKNGELIQEGVVKARCGDHGGNVVICGHEVTFTADSMVDVSGDLGGGHVSVQGDKCFLASDATGFTLVEGGEVVYRGPAPTSEEEMREMLERRRSNVGVLQPLFNADALIEGDGGSISIHSNHEQMFGAQILARGAGSRGNGGIAEICSKGSLSYTGSVDMMAPEGRSGHLLLDPKYVTIGVLGNDPATGNSFASDASGTVTISGADLEAALNSASVTIQANTDITFGDTVVATTSGNGLTLQAGRSIYFTSGGDLTLNNAPFLATINDAAAVAADREPGDAVFQMYDGTRIFTQGGDITVSLSNFTGNFEGRVILGQAIVEAVGGTITMTGTGFPGLSNQSGIRLSNTIVSTVGDINLLGTGGAGVDNNIGIYATGREAHILGGAGLITMNGTGGNSTGSSNQGVRLESGASVRTTSGSININGNAGGGTDWNMGVILSGTGSKVTSTDGDIDLTGVASGTGQMNQGVRLEIGSFVTSTGTGSNAGIINIDGTAAPGLANCTGVCVSGDGSLISSVKGNISVTGVGDSDGTNICDQGVRLEARGKIVSTGLGTDAATITVIGNGGAGTDHNDGVILSGGGSVITSVDGDISVTGIGAGTGSQNQGIRCESKGSILSTGTGVNASNINCIGTGANGTSMNNGVLLIGVGSMIDAVDGDIGVTGTAQGGGPTEGVSEQGGTINSANGTVSITSNDVP